MRPSLPLKVGAMCVALCLFLNIGSLARAQTQSPSPDTNQRDQVGTKHASGTFDAKLNSQTPENGVGDPTIGRMSIDKQFHGDLQGMSKRQVLAVGADVEGSAGSCAA